MEQYYPSHLQYFSQDNIFVLLYAHITKSKTTATNSTEIAAEEDVTDGLEPAGFTG